MENSALLHHIAVVSETKSVSFNEVAQVSAALQNQVIRDFGPAWDIRATVDAFAALDDVPIDYWPILVLDDIHEPGAQGIHTDKDGQPFALVQYSDGWSLTTSHECLEMLTDPAGTKVKAGPSPKPGQGRVSFLVEPCDASESPEFAYPINGVMVSDFYLPHYFDPVAVPGVSYSFTGKITQPRQVLKGGYISWHDPESDHWFQEVFFGEQPEFRDLGVLSQANGSIRTQIYRKTPEAFQVKKPGTARVTAARTAFNDVATSSKARTKRLRAQIDDLLAKT